MLRHRFVVFSCSSVLFAYQLASAETLAPSNSSEPLSPTAAPSAPNSGSPSAPSTERGSAPIAPREAAQNATLPTEIATSATPPSEIATSVTPPNEATSGTTTPSYLSAGRYTPPAFISEPTELPSVAAPASAWRLRKSDVIQATLRNNLGIQLERESVRSGTYSEQAASGTFEPSISASYRHRDSDSPPSNTQEGTAGQIINNIDNSWNISGSKQFHTATRADVSFNNDWSRSSQGNAISPDVFRTSADLTVTQPLLRGFSMDGDIQTAAILRARFSSKKALEAARLQAAATVLSAENAYWDLTEALKSYQVRVRSWELAQQQLKLTERQIQAGVLPPSDRINAEGTLARRGLSLVEAESNIERTADRLRQLMNLPEADWKKPLLTVDAPNFVELRPNLERLLLDAQTHRPELQQTQIDLNQAALDARVADNGKLPDLSASASYGLIGQDTTYGGALGELTDARGRYWSTFVRLNWTPLNEQREAEAARAGVARRRATLTKNQLLLNIDVEVRQAARAVETAEKQLYAAANSRSLSEQSLRAEERKFQNGMSNNFFVAQRQEELAQAELAELSALIRHEKARADLQMATGKLLEQRSVKLEFDGR
ncbi:MAG: TolC family protein [Polyangiaceae bacterium]|nr:TolC family protein [Polyangiaceae bacterium]